MKDWKKALCRLGYGIIILSLLLMMTGCESKYPTGDFNYNLNYPSYQTGNYASEDFVKEYISQQFAGCGYVTTKEILIDNTLAFGPWGDKTSVLSSLDDSVSFAARGTGSFGICKKVNVDVDMPLLIQVTADFDPALFDVYINAFEKGGRFLNAKAVSAKTGLYELDISSSADSEIQIIISATGKERNLGEPIVISAVKAWQEVEKFAVVVDQDENKIVEIVENANLTSSPYYTAPNGERYLLQVAVDGGLVMTPVIPSKALFVGNSLLTGFGFGMAASDSEHDYYALINQAISAQNSDYTVSKLSGTDWERATTYEEQEAFLNNVLLPSLDEDLELVVIQLGDNVNTDEKLAVFAEGSRRLLEFVRTNCPKARVVWVGAWYQTAAKQAQMEEACKKTGCTFIDIWDLATAENKSAVGDTYTDENGNLQTITSEGVASHPNDAGFQAIANRVLYKLGIADNEDHD